MGGQACVLYGAAEFSRDCDIALLCDAANIDRLNAAFEELDAVPIAVPKLEADFLVRGHAIHFRCRAPEAAGIRVDLMSSMRGVAPFHELWSRRTTLTDDAGFQIELMDLSDLISAKKTQRDKDWPMIRRLVEAHYSLYQTNATSDQVRFWLREARTPDMLIQLAVSFPELATEVAPRRQLIIVAANADRNRLELDLAEEEQRERKADRQYWEPLKRRAGADSPRPAPKLINRRYFRFGRCGPSRSIFEGSSVTLVTCQRSFHPQLECSSGEG